MLELLELGWNRTWLDLQYGTGLHVLLACASLQRALFRQKLSKRGKSYPVEANRATRPYIYRIGILQVRFHRGKIQRSYPRLHTEGCMGNNVDT